MFTVISYKAADNNLGCSLHEVREYKDPETVEIYLAFANSNPMVQIVMVEVHDRSNGTVEVFGCYDTEGGWVRLAERSSHPSGFDDSDAYADLT